MNNSPRHRMDKIDLKKELKHLYNPSPKALVQIDVPAMNFIMIDGVGDPSKAAAFQEAIEALYAVSYTIKFAIKKGPAQIDYGVMPLEGLWWSDDPVQFDLQNKDQWQWTLMIMQPEFVSGEIYERSREVAMHKKNLPAIGKIRFERFHEGLSAQLMHIGPFSGEGSNIRRIHDFIAASGHHLEGKHHEIYLSDFRRAAPEKLKTVIRQPYR